MPGERLRVWNLPRWCVALTLAMIVALFALAPGIARAANDFPVKPIRIIVSSGPGGATDIIARVLAEEMRQSLGQAVVIDNKPGANGVIALDELAHARPDGYTLMLGNVSHHAITPILFPKQISFDYEKGVVPVTRLVILPNFILTGAKHFAPKTFADFIAYTRANPDKVRYTSAGVGSYPHIDMELLSKRAGLKMIHLPIRAGGNGMIKELLGGDGQVSFLNVASASPLVKSGDLLPLAVASETRLPDFPDVPTMAEVGYPGVGTIAWQGLFVTGGTPPEVIETLFKAATEALKAPAVQERLKPFFVQYVPSASPTKARTWLTGELANWRKFLAEVNIDVSDTK